jgi:hypothetical protein
MRIDESAVTSREIQQNRFRRAPGQRELFVLVGISFVVMWTTIFLLQGSTALVFQWGDNAAYRDVANAIRNWDFRNVQLQHFMGYPYLIAALSLLLHVPTGFALWLVAVVCSAISVWLTARMFGTLTAAYFAFTNLLWLQLSYLGGSEPLAMALALGGFLAFRRNRPLLAALLGAVAVTVRPLMIFALVGIGVVLLYRKRFREFLVALAIGIAIGILYAAPLALYFGDPLLTFHTYTMRDYGGAKVVGPHGHLFGWPFHGIIAGTLAYPAPWTSLVLSFFWIAVVLFGVGMMFAGRFRGFAKEYPQEVIYCALYLLAIFSYDYLIWARSNFIRFCVPILPYVFFALLPVLPKSRWVFWVLCIVSAAAAAVSAIGLRNVMGQVQ